MDRVRGAVERGGQVEVQERRESLARRQRGEDLYRLLLLGSLPRNGHTNDLVGGGGGGGGGAVP